MDVSEFHVSRPIPITAINEQQDLKYKRQKRFRDSLDIASIWSGFAVLMDGSSSTVSRMARRSDASWPVPRWRICCILTGKEKET